MKRDSSIAIFINTKDNEADDLDLNDGAWIQFLQDAVTEFNKINKTNYKPYDTVMYYLNLCNEEQEGR